MVIKYEIITLDEAKDFYFQFRDSKNPIFYLYKLQEIDNNKENINKLDIKEIYNNIYDKTEGFEIKIEPWLNY